MTQRDRPERPPQPSDTSTDSSAHPSARPQLPGRVLTLSHCPSVPGPARACRKQTKAAQSEAGGASRRSLVVTGGHWEVLAVRGGYRMTQGGRLLVIFSSGSPFCARRIASIS